MPFGYNGKILRVDLTTRKMKVEEPNEVFYRTYLGGGGLASFYLLQDLPRGVDPLGPDNLLIFAASVITGTPMAGMCRFTVAAKSPLTMGYGEAEAGGFWGPELKFSGYDAIIIKGKAAKPIYLWIHDGLVEIRPADKLWGMETGPAQEQIREELNEKMARVAIIGPAGENRVRFASIVNELKHANGRGGLGAVMGSKNLKAVAVRGKNALDVSDLEKFLDMSKTITDLVGQWGPNKSLRNLGTAGMVMPLNTAGFLPTRNFRTGFFDRADQISGEKMAETILRDGENCYACAVRCRRAVEILSGQYATSVKYGGPEYETIASLGSLLLIDNLGAIAKGHELCHRYAMDPGSTGAAIAFAMECYENGLLTNAHTEGVDFRFGNAEAMLKAIEWIALRKEGLGTLLADGVKAAAAKIGQGAENFALHVKGQGVPMQDPRGKAGLSLSYAVSPTGAEDLGGAHDTHFGQPGPIMGRIAPLGLLEQVPPRELSAQKVRNYIYLHFVHSMYKSLGICSFTAPPVWGMPFPQFVEAIKAVTGWETSLWELLKAGERALTMARVFNVREGFGRKDDGLPDRFFEPLEGRGALPGKGIDRREFEEALTLYYEAMGWDSKDGVPNRGKLAELNLSWLEEFGKEKDQ